jgi:hypothetical protein
MQTYIDKNGTMYGQLGTEKVFVGKHYSETRRWRRAYLRSTTRKGPFNNRKSGFLQVIPVKDKDGNIPCWANGTPKKCKFIKHTTNSSGAIGKEASTV